ncbi:alpha-L-rhamnosidase C-terminal domain-containing protein [Haloterrigena salifodinae]|uniref:alpha-L-rhamnosidase C-terminal domain-containing protein n=1 Tax=Haloterrigena salifodinae TaxID=2675099 RepID=UPI0022772976|nr:alpha-L-rhamnosidase C-terminal domain-containing protein [Haloterrigena salifodinae]
MRRPTEPTFEHVEIAPIPVGNLDAALCHVDTVRGQIESQWELTEDGLEFEVAIPWNTTATVRTRH